LVEEKKTEISEDLKELVSTTIESIREGMKGVECGVIGPIEFEIAVIKSKEAKGGLKFFIADASGNYSKESISKINFKICAPRDEFRSRIAGVWLTGSK
jgi:hypothetical protein